MNSHAILAIYKFEMSRTLRTIWQSIVSPVISTSLYFVVFGAAIGSRITEIEGVAYGAFIVPGLIMLMLLTQSTMNASFGIYFPRFTGTIYELLSAPVSSLPHGAFGAFGSPVLSRPSMPYSAACLRADCLSATGSFAGVGAFAGAGAAGGGGAVRSTTVTSAGCCVVVATAAGSAGAGTAPAQPRGVRASKTR